MDDIKGCKVRSLGDEWMLKGSEGVVTECIADDYVIVRWDKPKIGALKGSHLTHHRKYLLVFQKVNSKPDPNYVFKTRRRGY